MFTLKNIAFAAAVAAVTCIPAAAQQATPSYGAPISLEQAKKVIAAAEAEAQKNNFFVVITVVDTGGYVVATHRLDNTQLHWRDRRFGHASHAGWTGRQRWC
jgi:uncharacterized protein GlcG (DUF336 family)